MTPEARELDTDFFLAQQPLILYRLARARYANLSGIGAALAPGRWNRAGQEAIYTSTEKGVPLLERLVHTPKDIIPANLALMEIRVSGSWEVHGNAFTDPRTDGCIWFCRSIANARDYFGFPGVREAMNPFAVAVPSVIVPVWNVVLYPQATGFWQHVSLESVDAFDFDPRLFPEAAVPEPPEKILPERINRPS